MSYTVKPWTRRRASSIVPEGSVPGQTTLLIPIRSDAELKVVVPSQASVGDRLVLRSEGAGAWRCSIDRSGRRFSRYAGNEDENEWCIEHVVLVPPDVVESPITLDVVVDGGKKVSLPQKNDVQPWEALILTETPSGAAVKLHRERVQISWTSAELQSSVTAIGRDLGWRRLAAAITEVGGYVSPKLWPGSLPPMFIPGIIALEDVEAGELLCEIPGSVCMSTRNVRDFAPELWGVTCNELAAVSPAFNDDTCRLIFIAQMINAARQRATHAHQEEALNEWPEATQPFGEEPNCGSSCCNSSDCNLPPAVFQTWSRYADLLLGVNVTRHAQALVADAEQLSATTEKSKPCRLPTFGCSATYDTVRRQAAQTERDYNRIAASLAGAAVGTRPFDRTDFIRACLLVWSRAHRTDEKRTLVPIVDMLNHATEPGVCWEWDCERSAIVMTAFRPHRAGEELFESYGSRSNPHMWTTHSFTLAPDAETSWGYTLFLNKLERLIRFHCPGVDVVDLPRCLMFDTSRNFEGHDDLLRTLALISEAGEKPDEFLWQICEFLLWTFSVDELLQPALEALQHARAQRPAASNWWEHLDPRDGRAAWSGDALRIRMSEYLCLTSIKEVVQVYRQELAENTCLENAASFRAFLVEALET